MNTLGLVSSTLALSLAACSSSYMPQARGRVAVVMRDGMPAYVRDGKTYSHGFLGGGLVDAVSGNPAAVNAANEYGDRLKYGLLGFLAGSVCSIGSLLYAARESSVIDNGSNAATEKALYLGLGCTIVMIVGASYMATAEPYRWDAINLFNDAPPPLPYPGAPAGAQPWSATRTSLEMRD